MQSKVMDFWKCQYEVKIVYEEYERIGGMWSN